MDVQCETDRVPVLRKHCRFTVPCYIKYFRKMQGIQSSCLWCRGLWLITPFVVHLSFLASSVGGFSGACVTLLRQNKIGFTTSVSVNQAAARMQCRRSVVCGIGLISIVILLASVTFFLSQDTGKSMLHIVSTRNVFSKVLFISRRLFPFFHYQNNLILHILITSVTALPCFILHCRILTPVSPDLMFIWKNKFKHNCSFGKSETLRQKIWCV
jgi:hypothetical protein